MNQLSFHGQDLSRPECVLATASGDLFASNWNGGVSRIRPDGTNVEILADGGGWLRPNGIAIRQAGTFLLAHLGDDTGGVFEMDPSGAVRSFLEEVDGETLPPTNYVTEDRQGRVWVTVSTRRRPRAEGYRRDVADGFLILVDERGPRIVAENLGYTNEAQMHPSGNHIYVNETFARRLSRFPVGDDGTVGPRETVREFGRGTFPDGLVFDEEGGIWITSIVSNRVIRLEVTGAETVVVEDVDEAHLDLVEEAYAGEGLGRPHLDTVASTTLNNISSLAFGGPDRRTAYLGCLLGSTIASFRAPVAGARPPHWEVAL